MTLDIMRNQKVLVMGRIGRGKSTLLKLIMKYDTPQSGQLYFEGKAYNDIDETYMRSKIGYVPQYPQLFNRTIFENITYGTSGTSKEYVHSLLVDLELEHMFDSFTDGLDMVVGKGGSKLSGGQSQVVWILRVMLQDPEILLLDEPTASIDDTTKNVVRGLLVGMMKHDRTVVMVSHDEYLVAHVDRLIKLS